MRKLNVMLTPLALSSLALSLALSLAPLALSLAPLALVYNTDGSHSDVSYYPNGKASRVEITNADGTGSDTSYYDTYTMSSEKVINAVLFGRKMGYEAVNDAERRVAA